MFFILYLCNRELTLITLHKKDKKRRQGKVCNFYVVTMPFSYCTQVPPSTSFAVAFKWLVNSICTSNNVYYSHIEYHFIIYFQIFWEIFAKPKVHLLQRVASTLRWWWPKDKWRNLSVLSLQHTSPSRGQRCDQDSYFVY
jgi:hypothetical protein